ncbi:MAG: GGDEF domain-containing protein [Streptosporangiaceae bacterium]
MSAVQDAIMQRRRALRQLVGWPWCWPLLTLPVPLAGYVLSIIAADVALIGWEIPRTEGSAADVILFVALMACGAMCVEATRRLGPPSGMSRDLLSAWWLPVALLLPPLYATAAPVILSVLMHLRVRRTAVYRRAFSTAALGLSGAAASVAFRLAIPDAREPALSHPGASVWIAKPEAVAVAVGCAILFSVLNTAIVAIAARLAEPDISLKELLLNRENLLLDVADACVGILVTVAAAVSPVLLAIALPPVILLQRSLMHAQLKAAARTDSKTGLLNAAAWQREADSEISRANRQNEPVSILLIDVDHFKRVNDGHGHLTGDDVLRGLATELRQQVRETDVIGRFGGEEFVVLLPKADGTEAYRIAERLRRSAGVVSVLAGDTPVGVTISVGVATSEGPCEGDVFELLAAADLALYRAKADGRNRVRVFEPENNAEPPASRL